MKKITDKQRKAAITILNMGSILGSKKDIANKNILKLRLMTGIDEVSENEHKLILKTAKKLNKK